MSGPRRTGRCRMRPGTLSKLRRLSHRSHVPLPKEVRFVTFDCYGTLIDWETGAYEAFQKEADRDGFTVDRNQLVPLFVDIQREIEGGSYELYAEVLRRTAVRPARGLTGTSSPRAPGSCPPRCRAGCRSGRRTPSS